MKKSILFLAVTLLLVFAFVQVSLATENSLNCPKKFNHQFNPVEALNLSDQQITQVLEINDKSYQQTRELRVQLMDKMHELKQLKLQKAPQQTSIDAKLKEITQLHEKIQAAHQKDWQEIQSLLTSEQKDKLLELKNKKGDKCQEGIKDAS